MLLKFLMFLAHEMADKGLIVQVKLLAILAKLDVALIYVLILVPAHQLALCVLLLKTRQEGLLKSLYIEQRPRSSHKSCEIAV